MVSETSAMLLCTGRALVWKYCTRPKTAPTRQTTSPRYIREAPLTPPNPSNLTWDRSGILISASPAKTPWAKPNEAARAAQHFDNLLFFFFNIKTLERDYCHKSGQLPTHFCQKQRQSWGGGDFICSLSNAPHIRLLPSPACSVFMRPCQKRN